MFLPTEQLVSKLTKWVVIASKNVTLALCPHLTLAWSEWVIEDATKIEFPALVACLVSVSVLWLGLSSSNTDPALHFLPFKYRTSICLNPLFF